MEDWDKRGTAFILPDMIKQVRSDRSQRSRLSLLDRVFPFLQLSHPPVSIEGSYTRLSIRQPLCLPAGTSPRTEVISG